jgi:hypothetical protein
MQPCSQPRFGRIVAFEDDRGLVAARGQVTIQAVGRDVELAIVVPADVQVVRIEGNIANMRGLFRPIQPFGDAAPETLRILHRFGVLSLVILFANARLGGEGRIDRIDL